MITKDTNKGFTLVELIVVIVILAILIGVTIGGIYMYVGKARINTDINNASSMNEVLSLCKLDENFNDAFRQSLKTPINNVTLSKGTSDALSQYDLFEAMVHAHSYFWQDKITIDELRNDSDFYEDCYCGHGNAEPLINYMDSVFTNGLPESKSGGYFCLSAYSVCMDGEQHIIGASITFFNSKEDINEKLGNNFSDELSETSSGKLLFAASVDGEISLYTDNGEQVTNVWLDFDEYTDTNALAERCSKLGIDIM